MANERIVDLTRFYDISAVKQHRAEILLLSDTYRARYREAYRALRAAGEVASERRKTVQAHMDYDKLSRRMDGILSRELCGHGEGKCDKAFLGGLTHRGDLCRYDTVTTLCPRVYELCDSYDLAAPLLESAGKYALSRAQHILACPSSDEPARFKHLLFPESGLAFVTSDGRTQYPRKPYRRWHIDAMAEKKLTRAERAKLRFLRRIEQALRDEAQSCLADAKQAHDALERAYHPYVDFDAVSALAHAEAEKIRSR